MTNRPSHTAVDLTVSLLAALWVGLAASTAAVAEPRHAIAMHGAPALADGFDHLPYADPAAPKGGTMAYGVFGTFDNLNPIIVRGATTTARGIWNDAEFGNLIFEPLMQRSADEPFTLYPLLADTVETDEDRTFVAFTLNPAARFSDGTPVRAEDVIFTTEMMRQVGVVRPQYTAWLKKVDKVEKVGERGVRFTFNDTADRELPLLLAGLPVLPEHGFDRQTFERTTLKPVIGSGPYTIATVVPNQRIVYRRNPDYWGRDLPVKRGLDNYDHIVVSYFRDAGAQFEAFKKGLTFVFGDGSPGHWQTAYDFPAASDGRVVKETFRTGRPASFNAFFFNTRRPVFADPAVRGALASLFDFEWANANLFYGGYRRTASFFDNTELSSVGHPADARENALLAAFPGRVEPEVMAGAWRPPVSNGSGSDRAILRKAVDALTALGYRFAGREMLAPDGQPLTFEILVQSSDQARLAELYKTALGRIGIAVSIRLVDDAQYQLRKQTFDYDMLLSSFSGTLSPGAEQTNRWGALARDAAGSFNYAGAADPAIDAMIHAMVTARSREDFLAAVRAYDRVLISGRYVVPLYYAGDQWLARWAFIRRPAVTPLTGYYLPAFWRDPAK